MNLNDRKPTNLASFQDFSGRALISSADGVRMEIGLVFLDQVCFPAFFWTTLTISDNFDNFWQF